MIARGGTLICRWTGTRNRNVMMGGLAVPAHAGVAVLEFGTTPGEAVIPNHLLSTPRRGPAQGRASYQRKQGRKGQLPVVGITKDMDEFSEERSKTREWGTWGCAWQDNVKQQVEAHHFLHMCWHSPSAHWQQAWGSTLSTSAPNKEAIKPIKLLWNFIKT